MGKQLLRRVQRLQSWILRPLQPLRQPHGQPRLGLQRMGRQSLHGRKLWQWLGKQLGHEPLCLQPLRIQRLQSLQPLWNGRFVRRRQQLGQRMGRRRCLRCEHRGCGTPDADLDVVGHQLQRRWRPFADQQGQRGGRGKRQARGAHDHLAWHRGRGKQGRVSPDPRGTHHADFPSAPQSRAHHF